MQLCHNDESLCASWTETLHSCDLLKTAICLVDFQGTMRDYLNLQYWTLRLDTIFISKLFFLIQKQSLEPYIDEKLEFRNLPTKFLAYPLRFGLLQNFGRSCSDWSMSFFWMGIFGLDIETRASAGIFGLKVSLGS